jgi:HlyD family secretion protein
MRIAEGNPVNTKLIEFGSRLVELQPRRPQSEDPHDRLTEYLRLARTVALALVAFFFLLAAVIQLTSAVPAVGEVSVYTRVKTITHPTGGVLAAVYVHDGDRVKKNQVMMRFDTAVSGVNAEVSTKTFVELLAMRARLAAERDDLPQITFPPELSNDHSPEATAAIAAENRLFELHRDALNAQRGQLAARITQTERQIASFRIQIKALHEQSALIEPEKQGMEELYAKKFATLAKVNALKRDAISLTSDAAALEGQIAKAEAQISEFRQQLVQINQDSRSQAGTALADVTAKVSDQQLRKATANDTYDRSAVRAPQDGIVDKLAFTTLGSMVPPMQTIMQIVPDHDRLTVEAKLSPNDVDQVKAGAVADLRFTAFNTRVTPQILGKVRTVSADRETDERTGSAFYRTTIDIDPGQLKRLDGQALVPGMPVEVYVQTGRRSMLSYLLKPFFDQVSRSFRQS